MSRSRSSLTWTPW
ncbi:hypothetical protein E2C01_081922 [Portunus trituberculatus]|uniref:Uncharacterized protein n=1 Tax=Portunus trituberculatus TaxID=210409 RepID=A0A5B7IXX2_PORTR|nr:hypothetical protein [Portunus trituberculatus]